MCIFGVESINITSLSREHVTHTFNMLYDDELYMLKSNKIYVMLCMSIFFRQAGNTHTQSCKERPQMTLVGKIEDLIDLFFMGTFFSDND